MTADEALAAGRYIDGVQAYIKALKVTHNSSYNSHPGTCSRSTAALTQPNSCTLTSAAMSLLLSLWHCD